MMRSVLVAFSLFGLVAAGDAAAGIETREVYVNITGPELQKLLRKLGYPAALSADRQGDPLIQSSTSGKKFQILFYTCNKSPVRECVSVQIAAGFRMDKPPTIFKLNDWNAKWRYTRAVRTKTGAVRIYSDLSFAGGVTEASVKRRLRVFALRLVDFRKYIGFDQPQ